MKIILPNADSLKISVDKDRIKLEKVVNGKKSIETTKDCILNKTCEQTTFLSKFFGSNVFPAPREVFLNHDQDRLESVPRTDSQKTVFPKNTTSLEDSVLHPFPIIHSLFPGALPNKELVQMVSNTLLERGFHKDKTLAATSLCCDEVNRPLESDISMEFGETFNMGGLAGFPFGGTTSFCAMAAHIPDGGSCFVVYGPHVGIDMSGNVGTVERRGRANGGACCGSAVAAAKYVEGASKHDNEDFSTQHNVLDAQQHLVSSMVMPYAGQLENAANKMLELPWVLYDAQSNMMRRIISKTSKSVAGDGMIALLGGIQINTPAGYSDYYMPLSFELYNNTGKKIDDFIAKQSSATTFSLMNSLFPGAYSNADLIGAVSSTLNACGYDRENTLVATSLCCDEVNRPLEKEISNVYNAVFNMGGLAGFPFGGVTSFGAMAAHIPDGGSCLIVHGPHVGVDSTGAVGTVERRGRANGGACCGSAVAAAGYVEKVYKEEIEFKKDAIDAIDEQQFYVSCMLMPYAEQLVASKDKMQELPRAVFDAQAKMLKKIIASSSGAVSPNMKLAVLGGIQINTPAGFTDYFLPLNFELYSGGGNVLCDLMPRFKTVPREALESGFMRGGKNGKYMDSSGSPRATEKETEESDSNIFKEIDADALKFHSPILVALALTFVVSWSSTLTLWLLSQ